MDNSLFYLIYKSQETSKMSIAQIEKLTNEAAKKNSLLNITGLLIRKNNGFIQYLEGYKTTISILYETILRDKRHHSITLLKKGYIKERKFGAWSMLLKHVTSEEINKIETLKTKNSKSFKIANSGNLNLILDLIKTYENPN